MRRCALFYPQSQRDAIRSGVTRFAQETAPLVSCSAAEQGPGPSDAWLEPRPGCLAELRTRRATVRQREAGTVVRDARVVVGQAFELAVRREDERRPAGVRLLGLDHCTVGTPSIRITLVRVDVAAGRATPFIRTDDPRGSCRTNGKGAECRELREVGNAAGFVDPRHEAGLTRERRVWESSIAQFMESARRSRPYISRSAPLIHDRGVDYIVHEDVPPYRPERWRCAPWTEALRTGKSRPEVDEVRGRGLPFAGNPSSTQLECE